MLQQDKNTFLNFVSGERQKVESALASLNTRECGHFEDHPISPELIAEHIPALIQLWNDNPVAGCRDWIAQFVTDAGIADARIKPLIVSELADPDCRYLPTLLYLAGTQSANFADIGPLLPDLARHPDLEVRWRVAWVISKMREFDPAMRQAIQILKAESDHTTQIYVTECEKRAPGNTG